MDPSAALLGLGGVGEVVSLRAAGASKEAIASAVAAGKILRVRRGCYALPDADPVRVAELAWHGVRTCVTALNGLGLPVPDSAFIHLAVPATRSFSGRNSRPPSNVLPHYFERTPPRGTAAAIDAAARCLNAEDHLIAVDAALPHWGLVAGGNCAIRHVLNGAEAILVEVRRHTCGVAAGDTRPACTDARRNTAGVPGMDRGYWPSRHAHQSLAHRGD